jgi:hypothetical protein
MVINSCTVSDTKHISHISLCNTLLLNSTLSFGWKFWVRKVVYPAFINNMPEQVDTKQACVRLASGGVSVLMLPGTGYHNFPWFCSDRFSILEVKLIQSPPMNIWVSTVSRTTTLTFKKHFKKGVDRRNLSYVCMLTLLSAVLDNVRWKVCKTRHYKACKTLHLT